MDFLRHAESEGNIGIERLNPPLTLHGREQAASEHLDRYYDVIFISPLRRCLETLHLSRIKYGQLLILYSLREHMNDITDFMEGEDASQIESEETFKNRVIEAKSIVTCFRGRNPGQSILLIGHSEFFFEMTSTIYQGEQFGHWLDNAELYSLTEDEI